MITLCGGLHFFRLHLDLGPCGQLVLDACAETLETLQLSEGSFYGEYSLPGEDFLE